MEILWLILLVAFAIVEGATLLQGLLCLFLFNIMIVNWNGMSYLTAIKDYQGILCSFAAAIGVACLCALGALALGLPPVEGLLASIALGYGVMLVWDVVLLFIQKNYKKMLYIIISGAICAVCYIPWLIVVFGQFANVKNNYWSNSDISLGNIIDWTYGINYSSSAGGVFMLVVPVLFCITAIAPT